MGEGSKIGQKEQRIIWQALKYQLAKAAKNELETNILSKDFVSCKKKLVAENCQIFAVFYEIIFLMYNESFNVIAIKVKVCYNQIKFRSISLDVIQFKALHSRLSCWVTTFCLIMGFP